MLSVLCPQCKSAYRVDEARIPPQGGVITCKQCQTRIPLRPPPVAPAEMIDELTDADEVADDAPPRTPGSAPVSSPAPGRAPAPARISDAARPPSPVAPARPPQQGEAPSLDISLPELGHAAAVARAAAATSTASTTAPAAAHPKGTLSAQDALAAHEVAPGSSLYECPHCHKPFYLSEAKVVPSKSTKSGVSPTHALAPVRAAPADGRKTVMVVDDQEFFRTFARDLLGRRYRVLEARTVAEAVEQLPECQLIVLDLTLENEDGREVLRRKPPGVKCLIFSGQEDSMIDPAIFRELQTMGADDMLFKSIAAGDALKEKVGRMLGEIVDEKPSLD